MSQHSVDGFRWTAQVCLVPGCDGHLERRIRDVEIEDTAVRVGIEFRCATCGAGTPYPGL